MKKQKEDMEVLPKPHTPTVEENLFDSQCAWSNPSEPCEIWKCCAWASRESDRTSERERQNVQSLHSTRCVFNSATTTMMSTAYPLGLATQWQMESSPRRESVATQSTGVPQSTLTAEPSEVNEEPNQTSKRDVRGQSVANHGHLKP